MSFIAGMAHDKEREALLLKLESHPKHRLLPRASMEKVVSIYLSELHPGPTTSLTLTSALDGIALPELSDGMALPEGMTLLPEPDSSADSAAAGE